MPISVNQKRTNRSLPITEYGDYKNVRVAVPAIRFSDRTTYSLSNHGSANSRRVGGRCFCARVPARSNCWSNWPCSSRLVLLPIVLRVCMRLYAYVCMHTQTKELTCSSTPVAFQLYVDRFSELSNRKTI